MSSVGKEFVNQGAIFWYVVNGLFLLYVASMTLGTTPGDIALVFGLVYLVLAFSAWRNERMTINHLVAMIMSAVIVILLSAGTLLNTGIGASSVVLALLALFFGFSSYRAINVPVRTT